MANAITQVSINILFHPWRSELCGSRIFFPDSGSFADRLTWEFKGFLKLLILSDPSSKPLWILFITALIVGLILLEYNPFSKDDCLSESDFSELQSSNLKKKNRYRKLHEPSFTGKVNWSEATKMESPVSNTEEDDRKSNPLKSCGQLSGLFYCD